MDVWAVVNEEDSTAKDDIPIWVKPLISPMRAQISAIAVEYGLYQGRFWLPRIRSAEGDAQVSFMHVPFKFEQSFKYASVNATDSLPEIHVAVRVPCNEYALEHSPDLPKSIYDEGEEIFGSKERDALIKEALSMGAQPPFAIGAIPPTLKWGLEFTRFNRIEGFSTGALVEQRLGGGYTASLLGRIGHADREPNVEVTLARSNMTTTVRGRAYNRLVSANDWGNPLSFGSSLSALFFGRDEGFYYRTTGAELEWERTRGALLTWRLFA